MASFHPKMDRESRAKQFMPFAALRGLEEALRAKERTVVPKSSLSEWQTEELDRALRQAKVGSLVTVVHYSDGEYVRTEGILSAIDKDLRQIRIVNEKIFFDDIYNFTNDEHE